MSNSLADSRMLSAPQERAAVDRSRDVLPRVSWIDLGALPAQQGVDAGQQLPGVKRLGEVVVGPRVQTGDAVLQAGAGGEHQNGGAQMPGAYLPGHGVAVQAGHHHVQNQQVVDAQLRVFRPGLPVIDGLSLKSPASAAAPRRWRSASNCSSSIIKIFNAVPPAFVPRVLLIIIQNEAERKLKTSGSFAVSPA